MRVSLCLLTNTDKIHQHQPNVGVPLDIYENISFSKFPAGSGYSLTEDQNHNDNNSGIYMSPLPALYM